MVENDKDPLVDDRRLEDRATFSDAVTVDFGDLTIVGPGKNISEHGVYFVADANPRVRVRLTSDSESRVGELVRVESLGNGRLGVAVRFVENDED